MRAFAACSRSSASRRSGRRSSSSEGRPAGTSIASGATGVPRSMRAAKTSRGLRPSSTASAFPARTRWRCTGTSASAPANVRLHLAQLEFARPRPRRGACFCSSNALRRPSSVRSATCGVPVERAQREIAARHVATSEARIASRPASVASELGARRFGGAAVLAPEIELPGARSTSGCCRLDRIAAAAGSWRSCDERSRERERRDAHIGPLVGARDGELRARLLDARRGGREVAVARRAPRRRACPAPDREELPTSAPRAACADCGTAKSFGRLASGRS